MNEPTTEYLQDVPTAVVGWTVNFIAFLVSMQDVEQWLRITSLIVGNLVGLLTVYKLLKALKSNKTKEEENKTKI